MHQSENILIPDAIPCVKVLSDSSVFFYRHHRTFERFKVKDAERIVNDELSSNSKRRIRRLTAFMFDCSRWQRVFCKNDNKYHWFRLGFLTLTLPASQLSETGLGKIFWLDKYISSSDYNELTPDCFKVSDIQIKQDVLNHYLTVLRNSYGVRNYLWKAEAQRNGNIHFHVIIDKFIHWGSLQYRWNQCLCKFHFIDEFEAKWGHRQPNTIKVHAVSSLKITKGYLLKYMCTDELFKRKILGKRWSCNEELSKYDGVVIELTGNRIDEWMERYDDRQSYRFDYNFCTVYSLTLGQFFTLYEGTTLVSLYVSEFQRLYEFEIVLS